MHTQTGTWHATPAWRTGAAAPPSKAAATGHGKNGGEGEGAAVRLLAGMHAWLCSKHEATDDGCMPAQPTLMFSTPLPRATLPPADHSTTTAAPAQTVWNGEGPDYDMLDVERLHDEMNRRPTEPDASQYDGEGRGGAGLGWAAAAAPPAPLY